MEVKKKKEIVWVDYMKRKKKEDLYKIYLYKIELVFFEYSFQ